jgi:hypothetical protein
MGLDTMTDRLTIGRNVSLILHASNPENGSILFSEISVSTLELYCMDLLHINRSVIALYSVLFLTHISVYSHVFTTRCSVAASNV